MLNVVKNIDPFKALFFDIETRGQVEKLEEGTKLYDLVEYTVARMKDYESEDLIFAYYDTQAALSP